MQSVEHSVEEHFLNPLKEHFSSLTDKPLQRELRQLSWERFLELGLPKRGGGAFQYLPLSQFYAGSYALSVSCTLSKEEVAPYIIPESQNAHVVFVNGHFQPHLSDLSGVHKQVVILPLQEAVRSYSGFLQQRWTKSIKEEKNPFVLLNAALGQEGLFVFIPPKIQIDTPIQCLYLNNPQEEATALFSPRVHLFVGASANVQWISTHACLQEHPFWFNGLLDCALEENAQLHHTVTTDLLESAWHFESIRATLKKHSQFKQVSVNRGAKSLRQDIRVSLLGEESEADLQGLWMLEKSRQSHTHILMEHLAPHCRSLQRFKGIVDDFGMSSFEGKIYVDKQAQKTEAYQLNNNLILGARAVANSKPNLEIFADDVKASHGATVAQLDQAQLFYLQTRGLAPIDAKTLLIQGFSQEVIDLIPHLSIRQELKNKRMPL
jgi:Fe-S cluster assembly protein SufD